ncbi:MAG: flippase [bacterium]
MNEQTQNRVTNSSKIATNSLINFAGYLALTILALWAIPIIIESVSNASFGLLSLIWAIVGYFALLDFGFGRAATKFLAKTLSNKDISETQKIIGTAFIASFLLGLLFCLVILAVTPILISDLLKIPPELVEEGIRAFRLSAFAIPLILTGSVARSVFMAAHRFGTINIMQTASGIIQWLGAVVAIKLGGTVYEIVAVFLFARAGGFLALILPMSKVVPDVYRNIFRWDNDQFKKLARFGGWVTVSQIVGPLILYVDRFIISSFLTLTVLAYYAVQQEIITRLLIIPQSLATSLYPAMSEMAHDADYEARNRKMYLRSVRYLALFMLPIILLIIVYAREMLLWWLGEEYATNGTLLLQIFAIGLFLNALAQVPFAALHAYGFPDLTAKFHLIELPITIVLNLIFIPLYGIVAAAVVWSFRALLDTLFLFVFVNKKIITRTNALQLNSIYRGLIAFILLLCGSFLLANAGMFFTKNLVMFFFVLVYLLSVWFYAFDDADRSFFFQLRVRILGR